MTKLNQVKMTLQKLLLKFGEKNTDKGLVSYVGEELEVGMEIFLNDEPAPDGDYAVADSDMIIRVADGKIAELATKEVEAVEEVEAEEMPIEEAPAEADLQAVLVEILTPITDKLIAQDARIAALETRLQEIEAKLLEAQAKPADEEIESIEVAPESNFFRATRK